MLATATMPVVPDTSVLGSKALNYVLSSPFFLCLLPAAAMFSYFSSLLPTYGFDYIVVHQWVFIDIVLGIYLIGIGAGESNQFNHRVRI